jgi:hypothetical protein
MHRRRARGRVGDQDHGRLGPARPGWRRFPARAQVAHRAQRSGAAADGGEHRRRRTRWSPGGS